MHQKQKYARPMTRKKTNSFLKDLKEDLNIWRNIFYISTIKVIVLIINQSPKLSSDFEHIQSLIKMFQVHLKKKNPGKSIQENPEKVEYNVRVAQV